MTHLGSLVLEYIELGERRIRGIECLIKSSIEKLLFQVICLLLALSCIYIIEYGNHYYTSCYIKYIGGIYLCHSF